MTVSVSLFTPQYTLLIRFVPFPAPVRRPKESLVYIFGTLK